MNDKQEQYRGGRQVLTDALGKPRTSKTDEFSEKFQTTFDPPPSFLENHIADFFTEFMTKVPFIMAKI